MTQEIATQRVSIPVEGEKAPMGAFVARPTAPGRHPGVLLFNSPTPVATSTAQVNAFIGTNLIHNYFRDRAPAFAGIDYPLRCNTGVTGTCNAFFTAGSSLSKSKLLPGSMPIRFICAMIGWSVMWGG